MSIIYKNDISYVSTVTYENGYLRETRYQGSVWKKV